MLQSQDLRVSQEKEPYIEFIQENLIENSVQDFLPYILNYHVVVATTRRNGTHSLLTSAKLSVDYLVVGITRELDKEPSLH